MSDGFVYFIQEEETGRIKIGFSEKHPKGRLNDFQTGNSNKLILLGYIEGTYQDESNLHQEFSEERIRNENEWFESSPRLVNRIKELLEESLEDKKSGIEDLNQVNEEETDITPDYGGIYQGEYTYGKPHGQGTITYHDGDRYEGEMKNGETWNGIRYDKDGKVLHKIVNGKSELHIRYLEDINKTNPIIKDKRDIYGNIIKE